MADGLDKTERLNREREENEKANEIKPLDPPFPFTVQEFDPSFFRIPANPPERVTTGT